MVNLSRYVVETVYPYKFHPCDTLKEAKAKRSKLRKQGIKATIIYRTENGNDYFLID